MELLEDQLEDQLIDAFDASSPTATLSAGCDTPQQRTRPSTDQLKDAGHTRAKPLYPSFDDDAPDNSLVLDDQQVAVPAVDHTGPMLQQPQNEGAQRNVTEEQQTQEQEVLTSDELQRRRLQIEREMRSYQERFDYVAQALARETPHQIEERKKREEERLDRQEKRLQHQIDRLNEREARSVRHCAKQYRTSRSLSPNSFRGDDDSDRLRGSQ